MDDAARLGRGAAWAAVAFVLAFLPAPAPALAGEKAGKAYRRAAEHYRAGRYEQALPTFEKALKEAQAAYDKDRQRLAVALSNVGELYRVLGRLSAAEPLLVRAVELADVPEGETRGLGSSLNNLALLYRDQGRYGEALDRQERALVVFEHRLGRDHPNAAKARDNLGKLRLAVGEPAGPPRLERVLGPRPAGADKKAQAARPPKPRAGGAPAGTRRTAAATRPAGKGAPPAKRHGVLVSSMRDAAGIPEEWLTLRRRFPALAGLDLRAPRPETTADGIVYRLVAGAFPAEAQAEAVCAELRSGGQHCRVVAL